MAVVFGAATQVAAPAKADDGDWWRYHRFGEHGRYWDRDHYRGRAYVYSGPRYYYAPPSYYYYPPPPPPAYYYGPSGPSFSFGLRVH